MTPNTTPKAGKKQSTRPSKSSAAPTDAPAQGTGTQTAPSGSSAACAAPQPAPFSLIGRIPVTEVFPVVEDGRWPAKAVVGEVIPIRATVFREGHDRFGATAVLVRPDGSDGPSARMHDIAPGLDRYEASVAPDAPGDWRFRVEGWSDPYATWCHDAGIKVPAGIDVELMLEEGARVLDRAVAVEGRDEEGVKALNDAVWIMRDPSNPVADRLAAGMSDSVQAALERLPLRDHVSPSAEYPLQVDRERALTGSWYEIFPRSLGSGADEDGTWHSGTLRSATERLDRIAAMGFDVLYLTPISPIGLTNRKGRNNTLTARPGDPGSPYGIGSPDGGHDAIHPDLGTFEDFDALVARSRELGMEVALDLALQCSPDHPWVAEHPEWFTVLADGSIAYAENPPKKYQDIYPLNFDNDPEGIYQAVRDVIELWIHHGVTIFRVDNPHTKPIPFWERLLADIKAQYPGTLFLAEAFTRPAMMRTLGAIGFDQSYTYFAWRTYKQEIEEYLLEISRETAHLMRPAFWPTTHDILTPQMWDGGTAIFAIRAMLAALGAPTWGIYSGYEFVENEPRGTFQEPNDNEKYEYRPRRWEDADAIGISRLFTLLNAARAKHPALRQLHQIRIHPTSSDRLIAFSRQVPGKFTEDGNPDTVICVISLDPHNGVDASVELDLAEMGLATPGGNITVVDELDGHSYVWGSSNWVSLSPVTRIGHVFKVEPAHSSPWSQA